MGKERQKHGFVYEKDVISRYGLEDELNYIHEWDAYYRGMPVMIKVAKNNSSIYFADIFRNAVKDKSFILIVGFWEGSHGNIVGEYLLHINRSFWREQFDEGMMTLLTKAFEGITNSYEDDGKWAIRMQQLKGEWAKHNSIFTLNLKRDHKTQKRIQCSMTYDKFHSRLLPYYHISSLDELFVTHSEGNIVN